MKHLTLCLLLLTLALATPAAAQDSAATTQVHKVIPAEGITKTELYNRARSWIATNFRSARNVIQLDDKDNAKIIVKGTIPYYSAAFSPGTLYSGRFHFTLTFQAKDGRYKYDIDNVVHEADNDLYSMGPVDGGKLPQRLGAGHKEKKIREAATDDIAKFAKSFEYGMKTAVSGSDNW